MTVSADQSLSPTMEDYLEAIGHLEEREGQAHVKDIAEAASVHMSTVTTALRTLSKKGLIHYQPYQAVTLTGEGRKVADRILGRHEAIKAFLSDILLVGEKVAEQNACRMEHVLDRQVIKHLSLFGRFVKECPRAGEDWLGRFRYFLEHDGVRDEDEELMKKCLEQFHKKMQDSREGDDHDSG
jgi:DtxR family Mn-dependent transcriptional regulator